ncbi:NfeD family protein [Salisediminibacterium beveridgei]|uniref:NfeD-like C-terminal domain-containing protein n=1 Tax=Salisediminibacterium beveridgei TaxID=632773 RepID=A0A1D7QUD2_9BACI|nr:NfeD family protein [Salisediminibacterium beveridgei]AOM82621.1 hypothetical protein BBEV_1253 [Salisediminibacterium beveridgei]
MEMLEMAAVGFVVVFIATLFIFGELMVRMKGFFAVLGILLMALYFSYHITGAESLWIVVLYLVGLTLIIFDGKVTADGSVGIFGVAFMVAAIALPSPGWIYGVLVAMALILAAPTSFLFTKVFRKRQMWNKILFEDKLTSDKGYNSMNETYKDLVGKKGMTKTSFRPTGTVEIENKMYSATSDNQWLDAETEVTIIAADGTRILVVPDKEDASIPSQS